MTIPTAQSYAQRLVWVTVMGTLVFLAALLVTRPSGVPYAKALPAIAIICGGVLPTIRYLQGSDTDQMPFLPLFGGTFAVCYGVTVFSTDHIPGYIDSSVVHPMSVIVALAGLLLFYIGNSIGRFLVAGHIRPMSLPFDGRLPGCRLLVWGLLLIHMALAMSSKLQQIGTVSQLMNPAGYIALGMLYILWQEGRLTGLERFLFLGLFVPIELIWGFSTGVLATIIFLGLFFQVVYWRLHRRIPWTLIIGIVIFFLVMQPVKIEFRNYTYRHGRYANLGAIGRVKLLASLTYRYYTGQISRKEERPQDPAVSRVADIRVLAVVLKQTPEPIGYWNGHSLKLLLTNLVPRILWPEKPREVIGQDFGHRYGLIADSDYITSINLPWMAEFYVNFGMTGLILGMLIAGLAIAILQAKFAANGMDNFSFVVGAAIVFRLGIDHDSNLSVVMGVPFSLWITLDVYFRVGYWLLNSSVPTLALQPKMASE